MDSASGGFERMAAALSGLTLPLVVRATPATPDAHSLKPPIEATDVIGLGASLAMVIAAVVVVGWLYARSQGVRSGNGSVIKILAAQPLGSKERIVLVEIGGKQIVLGMTAAQVQTLHVFDEPVVEASAKAATGIPFADRLRTALRGVAR